MPSTLEGGEAHSQQKAISWWALQFTPRVALLEEAVVLEVAASQRLFGGEEALCKRVCHDAVDLGCTHVAWAPTATGALALGRHGEPCDGFARPLADILDPLPFQTLTAAAQHQTTLSQLGCKTLGDVRRRLPRGGLARRFGKELLAALDAAYGVSPEAFEWITLPDIFDARLELPSRVDVAEGLLFAARRLLMQLSGWLAARHAGIRAFTIQWKYDFHRSSAAPGADELTIRTAETTRTMDHFARLLGEQLARIRLAAAVEEIRLRATEVEPLEEGSKSLLLDGPGGLVGLGGGDARTGETVTQLIERLSARLGPDQVLRAELGSDYRPECVQAWKPATTSAPARGASALLPDLPQPTWLLARPLRLAVRQSDGRPMYQGLLELLSGPHRIEAAWWDRDRVTPDRGNTAAARRDYFVMASPHAGLLWVYCDRAAGGSGRSPWYLHGIFG